MILVLGIAVVAAAGWAAWVFTRPEVPGANGPNGTPVSLSPEEVRVLAMDQLQGSVAQQMRLFVDEGRFSDDLEELGDPGSVVVDDRIGPQGVTALEVCADDTVVVLSTTAADGSMFAVKAQGLEPHADGEAAFSHYTTDPACDTTRGAASWPGGYAVSRMGLVKGGRPADIPLS